MDTTGFDAMPDRHRSQSGREVCDLMRDAVSDEEFAAACLTHAIKYEQRNKSDLDPDKARWWREMMIAVRGQGPDPRHQRPTFEPYRRASLPEPLPERRIDVLDHGFVRFVEDWGQGDSRVGEAGIIEAARQSTQGNFRGWRRDRQLLRYLKERKHDTPFEFAGMVLEVRAPIFVFREWHRHRTQSYNEMSARYAPLPDLNYLPTMERIMQGAAANANKQAGAAKGAVMLTEQAAGEFKDSLQIWYSNFEQDYQMALANGVPKELARCGMPVGRYSQMRASAVLRNWLSFLTLRMDPGAQWEIRQYAAAVFTLIQERFPQTAALFQERT